MTGCRDSVQSVSSCGEEWEDRGGGGGEEGRGGGMHRVG